MYSSKKQQTIQTAFTTTSEFNIQRRFPGNKKPAQSGLFQVSMSAIRLAVQLCEA